MVILEKSPIGELTKAILPRKHGKGSLLPSQILYTLHLKYISDVQTGKNLSS